MKTRIHLTILTLFFHCLSVHASRILIPMDAEGQANHLKAYGIAFAALQHNIKVDWLLNYRGGSFVMKYDKDAVATCDKQGVSYVILTNRQYAKITKEIAAPAFNGDIITLDKAPKIAVYTPPNQKPWDDAVTLALSYAGIPFDELYADDVLAGKLQQYDWLHLHHEDFTGQYGRFWAQFRSTNWYQDEQRTMEAIASRNGYKKVSQLQLAVVKKIRDFVSGGGNLFAMCSATDSYDIALAAENTDICDSVFDGDPAAPDASTKLDFTPCFAFRGFNPTMNPYRYDKSDIDNTNFRHISKEDDYFALLNVPAKYDHTAAMLCQNHTDRVKGFMGQTTAFRTAVIKPGVQILGDGLSAHEAKYIHGEFGNGTWTFFGGHDPEDYQHQIYNAPTNLDHFPHSPGYRLILNNVLFPATKRQIVPTIFINDNASSLQALSNENATGNKNLQLVKLVSLFPNPVDNELSIVLNGTTGIRIRNVFIVNMDSKTVFSNTYHDVGQVNVNLKDMAPGIYLVKVNDEYAGKIVKE